MELEHIAVRSGRLSSFLKGELNMSTGLMNRLKWTGALLVNGQPARTNTQVTPGDRITALLDDPEPEYPAEDMPLEIRYEDRDLLVVDKPPGMLPQNRPSLRLPSSHPAGPGYLWSGAPG